MKVNYAGQMVDDNEPYGGRPEHQGEASIRQKRQEQAAKMRKAKQEKAERLRQLAKAKEHGVLTTAKIFG